VPSVYFNLAKIRNHQNGWIAEQAAEVIHLAASKAHPRETGGILVGVLVEGRPWITHAVEIRGQRATLSSYEVPSGTRSQVVDEVRKVYPCVGYLGEWHVHPKDIGASVVDIEAIRRIKNETKANCRNPVLLIARRIAGRYQLDADQWVGSGVRPIDLLLTGSLPMSIKPKKKWQFELKYKIKLRGGRA